MNPGDTYDVIVVGGGVMGCSVGYHLAAAGTGLSIAIVERDPTYARASSALSVGNARVQFSLRENVRISLYAFAQLEVFAEEMAVGGVQPDVRFRPEGNLFLVAAAEREAAAEAMALQTALGGEVEWFDREEIERRHPIYRMRGLPGGTFGSRDGHLDGYALLQGYRAKAQSLGVEVIEGDVVEIEAVRDRVAGVELATGAHLSAGVVVNCSGAWAADLLWTAGVRIPVRPVTRQAFVVAAPATFDQPLPLTVLPSGLYFRSEGPGLLLVGRSLPDDPEGFGFAWQESRFEEVLWPELVALVPAFDRLRLVRGWAGLYAVNTLDGNAILGEWPEIRGLFLANGFSGHGLQQAPAVGRHLAELILGQEPSLDLSALGPERVLLHRPLSERGLV